MNKTILIAGGATVASLAIGTAGGFIFAKVKYTKEFDERLSVEIAATKKHYSVLLMQAREEKPMDVTEVVINEVTVTLEEPEEEPTPEAIETEVRGKAALTNYQGFASKPPLVDVPVTGEDDEVETHNIFADKPRKPPMPPRDPENGKFIARTPVEEPAQLDPDSSPYRIDHDDFLGNPFDYTQENIRYFAAEDTLIDYAGETIDNEFVGQHNLKMFVASDPDAGEIICVRNEALETDYEIKYTTESLTEYLGLSES